MQNNNAGTKGNVIAKNVELYVVICLLGSHHRHYFRRIRREQRLFVYQEVGNYNGVIKIRDSNAKEASLAAPVVSKTVEIQVILELKTTQNSISTDTAGRCRRQALSMKSMKKVKLL